MARIKLSKRARVALTAFGLAIVGVIAAPAVRMELANRAEDAEYAARAARVCPPGREDPGAGLTPPEGSIPPAATSGQVFLSDGSGARVSIVDLATGRVTTLPARIDDPHEVAVSPDGRFGVVADFGDYLGEYRFDGNRLAVFDLADKRFVRLIELGEHRGPHDVVFLPGSSRHAAVTTQTTRHVVVVDVETGQIVRVTPTQATGSHTLAIAADGRTAFTANEGEGTVSRLDLETGSFVAKFTADSGPAEGIAVTPDGGEVWVGLRQSGEVRVLDGTTGSSIAVLGGFVRPDRIVISPDGRRAVITDWACEVVRVVDVASHRVLGPIAGLEGAGVAKVLPDSRMMIVVLPEEGVLAIADLDRLRVVRRHDLGKRVFTAAWGPIRR